MRGAAIACACLLAPATAAAATTVVEAESMQWPAGSGRVYGDSGASGGGGFLDSSNSWGTATVDLGLAPTGLKVRVRSAQRSPGAFGCMGKPEVAVRIGATTVVTGAGVPHMAGIQTIDEVTRRGVIDHVVSLTVPYATDVDPSHPNPDWSPVRAPAIRSDGDRDPALFPDAIEEGTRFRLPASLDIDALGLTSYGKILARAIQRYGAIVVNRNCAAGQVCAGDDPDSDAAVSFYAEIPRGSVNPWKSRFGRSFPLGALRNFPWAQLQVLPPYAG